MSFHLRLASLGTDRVMPALSRPQADITLANTHSECFSIGNQTKTDPSEPNDVYRMKEYSLINHIESLKAVVSSENSKESRDQPISQICLVDTSSSSPSLKWALDPAAGEGNLRIKSSNKQLSYTPEDVISRGSSCAKESDVFEDENHEKPHNQYRKKSGKVTKKKNLKKKDGRHSIHVEKDTKQALSSSVFPDFKKKYDSSNDTSSCDISVLTALCKSIQIHQKTPPNSISVKDTPYPKKSSPIINNAPRKSVSSSPAKTSLSHAMIEYTKKHSTVSDLRRKNSSSVDEIVKTKVFLSEKQSRVMSDCGNSFPCAPPATPTTDHLKRTEYVPSLQDIRSQRSFRQRLQNIESRAMKKEKRKQEDNDKIEKITLREKRTEKKKKQRQEIYALNKLMTDWEHERFLQFMSQAGSNL